jgi:hypothetical protein
VDQGGGWREAESYDYYIACAFINCSIHSGQKDRREQTQANVVLFIIFFLLKKQAHFQPVMMEKIVEGSKTLGTPLLENCSAIGMEADGRE